MLITSSSGVNPFVCLFFHTHAHTSSRDIQMHTHIHTFGRFYIHKRNKQTNKRNFNDSIETRKTNPFSNGKIVPFFLLCYYFPQLISLSLSDMYMNARTFTWFMNICWNVAVSMEQETNKQENVHDTGVYNTVESRRNTWFNNDHTGSTMRTAAL